MILFVSQWFPSDINKYYAPFIKEHMLALSEQEQLIAITGNITRNSSVRVDDENRVTNYRIPLNPDDNYLYNIIKFNLYAIYYLIKLRRLNFELIVVNVFTSIFFAYFAKTLLKCRLIFIEHWSFWVRRKTAFLSRSLGIFDDVYVVSENVKNSFDKSIQNKTKIVENVVDDTVFDRTSELGKDLIFVGRLERIKRVDRILEAFALAKIDGVNLNIVGTGSELDKLIILTNELGIKSKVIFHGALNKSEIALLFNKSKALLLFSETENKPCVICEANFVGLPVISNNVGGIRYMVNSTNGIVVNNDNVIDYSVAIRRIYTISFDYCSISKNAKQRYSKKTFSKSVLNESN
ncbi:glycosyltransferase family 4 protein [Aeromonas enterica]